jgi:Putative zinc-finger
MREISKFGNCESGEELIAFLYGELDNGEARKFQQHMQTCDGCHAEYATFADLRESIVTWRNESLSAAFAAATTVTHVAPVAFQRSAQRKSALAAIREFFDLSPLWMKGAVAFASLLFCLCAVLAIAYVKSPQPIVAKDNGKVYSKQEVDTLLAAERKKQQSNAIEKPSPKDEQASNTNAPKRVINRPAANRSGYASNVDNPRRPLTRQERNELATDLRLVASKDDDDLDLIGDSNRQTP